MKDDLKVLLILIIISSVASAEGVHKNITQSLDCWSCVCVFTNIKYQIDFYIYIDDMSVIALKKLSWYCLYNIFPKDDFAVTAEVLFYIIHILSFSAER